MNLGLNTHIWYHAMKNGVPKPVMANAATLIASHGLFLTDVGSALDVSVALVLVIVLSLPLSSESS